MKFSVFYQQNKSHPGPDKLQKTLFTATQITSSIKFNVNCLTRGEAIHYCIYYVLYCFMNSTYFLFNIFYSFIYLLFTLICFTCQFLFHNYLVFCYVCFFCSISYLSYWVIYCNIFSFIFFSLYSLCSSVIKTKKSSFKLNLKLEIVFFISDLILYNLSLWKKLKREKMSRRKYFYRQKICSKVFTLALKQASFYCPFKKLN